MHILVSGLAVILWLGFLTASAGANFEYASHLSATAMGSLVYGLLSASVSGWNAINPFLLTLAWRNRNWPYVLLLSVFLLGGLGWSLQCAYGFGSSNRGEVTSSKDAVTARYGVAQQQLKEAEAALAALSPARPVEVIERALETETHDRLWLSSKNCTDDTAKASREFCKARSVVETELATACEAARLSDLRDALRRELDTLNKQGAGVSSDPLAAMLAKVFHVERGEAQDGLNIFLAVFVEFGAAFGLFFALGHGGGKPAPHVRRGDDIFPPDKALPVEPPKLLRLGYASDGTLQIED